MNGTRSKDINKVIIVVTVTIETEDEFFTTRSERCRLFLDKKKRIDFRLFFVDFVHICSNKSVSFFGQFVNFIVSFLLTLFQIYIFIV